MFETLFRYPAIIDRHRNGPFAEARERFLEHRIHQGYAPATLQRCAQELLVVAERIDIALGRLDWSVLLVFIKVRFLSPPYSNYPGPTCLTHLGTEGSICRWRPMRLHNGCRCIQPQVPGKGRMYLFPFAGVRQEAHLNWRVCCCRWEGRPLLTGRVAAWFSDGPFCTACSGRTEACRAARLKWRFARSDPET